MVNDNNTYYVYVKNTTNVGGMTIYNVTKKTEIGYISMDDYSYSSAKIECKKGEIVYIKITPASAYQTTDYVYIYFTGFSNLSSSATAQSTITSNVNYGSEINFGTPQMIGKKFVGWYTEDNLLYDSKYYDVDHDLVLTARFE